MRKTLVNIISVESPLPAYLFTKEMYRNGDRLMLISSRSGSREMERLVRALHVPDNHVERIVLQHEIDAIRYEYICRTLKNYVRADVHYNVNLAGGTRYMAIAVQHAFSHADASFYYVNQSHNEIVNTIYDDSIYDDDDLLRKITYRMTIPEYLELHGLHHDLHHNAPIYCRSENDCERMFNLFSQRRLNAADMQGLTTLRESFRGAKSVRISDVQRAIPHLSDLFEAIGFCPQNIDLLNKRELDWLTGGWFEEWVAYQIVRDLRPDELAIGVRIKKIQGNHDNELDVVFIKANHLYVIECKTGIQTDARFNEIVYKACALKEALLGLSCHSYIFTLKPDLDDHLERIAESMGVHLVPHEVIVSRHSDSKPLLTL